MVTAPAHRLTRWQVWWHASRPATLAASVAPVIVGTSVAVHERGFRFWPAFGALLTAVALQFGVNYANDYSDFRRGADTPRRIGPVRAASSGIVPPEQVRRAAITAFGLAGLSGLVLSLLTDPRLLVIGMVCLLAGYLYTGGPRPYGYLGLGELFVFLFFGLVATLGTVYVEELRITTLAWLAAIPLGCLSTAILVLNNLRDIETDRVAGKRTLAVRWGREPTRVLLFGLVLAAFVAPALVAATRLASAWILLPLLALPLVRAPLLASFETAGPPLVRGLKRMAAVELAFAALWAAAMAVG